MGNMHHLIDLKMSLAGIVFLAISVSGVEISLKIIGSIFFIGYTVRRWYLMERNHKNGKND